MSRVKKLRKHWREFSNIKALWELLLWTMKVSSVDVVKGIRIPAMYYRNSSAKVISSKYRSNGNCLHFWMPRWVNVSMVMSPMLHNAFATLNHCLYRNSDALKCSVELLELNPNPISGVAVKSTLDNTSTVQYAGLMGQLADKARSVVRDLDPSNDLTFLRIRSKKHEIMIAPDKDFIMIVIQNPTD